MVGSVRSGGAARLERDSSSTIELQMKICSFARNRSCSSGSRVSTHPTRMPGRPKVFDIDDTEMARSDRLAATGSGSGKLISR
jgi:hypothetical protein